MGLIDALFGNNDTCSTCGGSGLEDVGNQRRGCSACDGSGSQSDYDSKFETTEDGERVCHLCKGSGYMGHDTDCPVCS